MLQATVSDSQLAWVVGHEVGNHLADHHGEAFKTGSMLLPLILPFTPMILPGIALLGPCWYVELLLLRFDLLMTSPLPVGPAIYHHRSQKREYEADEIGLFLMAAAGYDVNAGMQNIEALGDSEKQLVTEVRQRHPEASITLKYDTRSSVNRLLQRNNASLLLTPTGQDEELTLRIQYPIPFVQAALQQSDRGEVKHIERGSETTSSAFISRGEKFARQKEDKRRSVNQDTSAATLKES